MKIKYVLFSLLFLPASFLQGCMSSGTYQDTNYQNNNSQNNDTQYGSTQDNSDYPEYNVDDLNQYGYWQDDHQYGRVWRPSVVVDWSPFNNGHWAYDGNDWVWVSYEPFGWIVYHYGNWENTPDYGWIWIPSDNPWSPARVQWYDYGDEVGWAPMRSNNRSWPEPWENGGVRIWTVVKTENFTNEDVHSFRVANVNRSGNNLIERRPPEVKTVQQYIKRSVQIVKIDRVPVRTQPIQTNQKQPVQNDNPKRVNPPVGNNNPPRETPPVVNDNPRRVNPPVGNNNPPRVDPPVQNNNPPRTDPRVINENPRKVNPPVVENSNNPTAPKQRGRNQIYNIQMPQQEKDKVDRNRTKVEKNVLIKKDTRQNNNQKPVIKENPKTVEKRNEVTK